MTACFNMDGKGTNREKGGRFLAFAAKAGRGVRTGKFGDRACFLHEEISCEGDGRVVRVTAKKLNGPPIFAGGWDACSAECRRTDATADRLSATRPGCSRSS